MKKLLSSVVLFLALGLGAGVWAQSTSGGGGNPPNVQCVCDLVNGDVSTGCYSTKNGLGNNPWSMSLVVEILRPAKEHFNLSLGQMIQRYHDCGCVITYLGGNYFRVEIGGGLGVVILTDGL